MTIDRYTKAVLTVIAGCLLWICAMGSGRPVSAQQPTADVSVFKTPIQPVVIVGTGSIDEAGRIALNLVPGGGPRRTDPTLAVSLPYSKAKPLAVALPYDAANPLPAALAHSDAQPQSRCRSAASRRGRPGIRSASTSRMRGCARGRAAAIDDAAAARHVRAPGMGRCRALARHERAAGRARVAADPPPPAPHPPGPAHVRVGGGRSRRHARAEHAEGLQDVRRTEGLRPGSARTDPSDGVAAAAGTPVRADRDAAGSRPAASSRWRARSCRWPCTASITAARTP